MMGRINLVVFAIAFCWSFGLRHGSCDADALRVCVEQCQVSGCVGLTCFKQCNYSSLEAPSWSRQQPAYVEWNHWVCESECRYHCTVSVDDLRQKLGFKPQRYQRRWPAKHFHGIQEPVPAALSGVALAMHYHGWISFMIHVHYKLPLRPNKNATYYEYTGLFHVYALLAMNGWLWAGALHCRDAELTEKLNSISSVLLLGYTVFLAIVRCFSVKGKVARLMVATPVFALAVAHMMYMKFYKYDHRLNTIVCMLMYATNMALWSVFVGVTSHPARWKMWYFVFGGGVPMLALKVYDFHPYWGVVDAHSIWHAIMIPLIYIWWSFIRDDTEFRTSTLIDKEK